MADEELIARLRSMHWCVTTEANGVGVSDSKVALDAADRIEALTKERDEAVHLARLRKTFIEEARDERDAFEAKLAKAVEIGNKMAHSIEGNYYIPGVVKEWRATISDLKQEGSKT